MRYSVQIKPSAEKSFAKLNKSEQIKILKALESLENNPRPKGVKKLKSSLSLYRIRTGNYRIIYSIDNDIVLITVVKIGHRKEIYK